MASSSRGILTSITNRRFRVEVKTQEWLCNDRTMNFWCHSGIWVTARRLLVVVDVKFRWWTICDPRRHDHHFFIPRISPKNEFKNRWTISAESPNLRNSFRFLLLIRLFKTSSRFNHSAYLIYWNFRYSSSDSLLALLFHAENNKNKTIAFHSSGRAF